MVQATLTTLTDIIIQVANIVLATVQVVNTGTVLVANTSTITQAAMVLAVSTDIILVTALAVSTDTITLVTVRTTLQKDIVLAARVLEKTKRKERNGVKRKRLLLESYSSCSVS